MTLQNKSNLVDCDYEQNVPEAEMLTLFFSSLSHDEIPYCVLRNYHTLPESVPGSDVDLLVPVEYLNKTIQLLTQCVKDTGWIIQQVFEKNYRILHYRLLKINDESKISFLLVDLMTDIGLGPTLVIEGNKVVEDRRLVGEVWAPAAVMEQQINVLNAVYSGKPMKQRYRSEILPDLMSDSLRAPLIKYLGNDLTGEVLDAIKCEKEYLLKKPLGKAVRKYAFQKSSTLVLRDYFHYLSVQLSRIIAAPGIMVVFLGPDGVGKSTIATSVCERLGKVFPDVAIQHLRPHLIPALGELAAGETVNEKSSKIVEPKLEKSRLKSLVRLLYYSVDYVAGYWTKIRPNLARGKLLVFDRYFYDYFVDHIQKGVNLPDWLIRGVCSFFPSPHKVFVLSAKPEVVRQRRDDLDENEINRQVQGFTDLQKRYGNVHIVDASKSIEELTEEIIREIFKNEK